MTTQSLIPEHLHANSMSTEIKKSVERDQLLNHCLMQLESAYKRIEGCSFPLSIDLRYEIKGIYGKTRRYRQKHIDFIKNELEYAGYTVTTTGCDCKGDCYFEDRCYYGEMTIKIDEDAKEEEIEDEEGNEE